MRHNYRYFGSWVRQLRLKRGYSQRQVALAVGKSTSWVCELEKGRRGVRIQDPEFYIALAEYMNVPLGAVLDAANIPKTKEDQRHHSVYRMVRNRSIAQRIVKTIDELEKTSNSLEILSTDKGGRMRHLCQTLLIQIQDLKSALRLL